MQIVKLLNEIQSGNIAYTSLSNKNKVRVKSIMESVTINEAPRKLKEVVPLTDEASIKKWLKKHGYSKFKINSDLEVSIDEDFYYPQTSEEMKAINLKRVNGILLFGVKEEFIDLSKLIIDFSNITINNCPNLQFVSLPQFYRGGVFVTVNNTPLLKVNNPNKLDIITLTLSGKNDVTKILDSFSDIKIHSLNISSNATFESCSQIPSSVKPSSLDVQYCSQFTKLGDIPNTIELIKLLTCGIENLTMSGGDKLYKLSIIECPKLVSLNGLSKPLKFMELKWCHGLEDLSGLENSSIEDLQIKYCDNIESLYGSHKNDNIESITIEGCNKLKNLKFSNKNATILLTGQKLNTYKGIKLNRNNALIFLNGLYENGISSSLTDIDYGDTFDLIKNSKLLASIFIDYVRFCVEGFTDDETLKYIEIIKDKMSKHYYATDSKYNLNDTFYKIFLSDLESSLG